MSMNQMLVAAYRKGQEFHAELVRADAALRKTLSLNPEIADHVDAAYALRELERMSDECRKVAKLLGDVEQKTTCVLASAMGSAESIRTDHCTATPQAKTIASVPRQSSDPDGYCRLMQYLKVPEELWGSEEEHSVLQPHWPGLMEKLNRDLERGLPLPDGIDPNKTYTEHKLRIQGKKSVTE
jgi:hypothetical protein